MPTFFYIQNHSSSQLHGPSLPWEQTHKRPEFDSKESFRRWCAAATTEHYFYTAYEPVNPGLRISANNPAYKMHAFVVDYDSAITEAHVADLKKNITYPPSWIGRTFSGGRRLIWLFEEPLMVAPDKIHREFIKILRKELRLTRLLPGLDEEAIYDVAKTYELGEGWCELSKEVIPAKDLQLWFFQAGDAANWSHRGEVVIPIDAVAKEVEKQYPGKWTNSTFDLGSRGPRFWDQSADCATAAIVRETGMQCFTGPKPFVPWSEILGVKFVRDYEADRIATATKNVWYDGMAYWHCLPDGRWFSKNKEDTALFLKVACGLSQDRPRTGGPSEVERAIFHVQTQNSVDCALPFVLQTPGSYNRAGRRCLNIANAKALAPADIEHIEWGQGFPFLARLLDPESVFKTREQWEFFMAWLRYFYVTGLKNDLRAGQSIFIAGPTNHGKTLISNCVIGGLVGGHFDVTSYLLGETSFNGPLFGSAVWTVDDSHPGKSPTTHAHFSAMVKKLAANRTFEYNAKYRKAELIDWRGRLVVTLNTDPESLVMLPDPEISILDKVCFFQMAERPDFEFPPAADAVVRKELPAFARWLWGWEIPEKCLGSSRFAIKEFHDPWMLNSSRLDGRTNEFREILTRWSVSYFVDKGKPSPWEGTSADLLQVMKDDDSVRMLVGHYKPVSLGRELGKLKAQGGQVEERLVSGMRRWTIPPIHD
jgi:hypothetical protein